MRRNIHRRHSTKHERVLYELLKRNRIPFRHRWLVDGREVDFIVGNYAIEINGHDQDQEKTTFLAERGYIPVHLPNELLTNNTKELEIWLRKIQSTQTV